MTRIDDDLLQSVVFIYPSIEDARAGRASGGTGFLVNYPIEPGVQRIFVVTNSHVVLAGGQFVRLNSGDATITYRIEPDKWTMGDTFDDIAVAPLPSEPLAPQIPIEWSEWAIEDGEVEDLAFGIGDEVVMLGRLADYDGGEFNSPVARFGNIARMADVASPDADGNDVNVFWWRCVHYRASADHQ